MKRYCKKNFFVGHRYWVPRRYSETVLRDRWPSTSACHACWARGQRNWNSERGKKYLVLGRLAHPSQNKNLLIKKHDMKLDVFPGGRHCRRGPGVSWGPVNLLTKGYVYALFLSWLCLPSNLIFVWALYYSVCKRAIIRFSIGMCVFDICLKNFLLSSSNACWKPCLQFSPLYHWSLFFSAYFS